MILALLLAGCGGEERGQEAPAPATNTNRARFLIRGMIEAYGGEKRLREVERHRSAGIMTIGEEVGEAVRWFQRPDRLREERRYPSRGEIRIAGDGKGWSGPDDQGLRRAGPGFAKSLRLQAARLDLPLGLLERADSLETLPPDEEGREVLRAPFGDGLDLEIHIDPESRRIVHVTSRMAGPPPVAFEIALGEFRWVEGVLFPFKEAVSIRGRPAWELRLREVEVNPRVPGSLFHPLEGD